MVDIPLSLRHAIESGECVLFLGAGIGQHFLDADGEGTPSAAVLAEDLANEFLIETENVSDLAKISTIVELRKGRLELEAYIRSRLSERVPDETIQWLFTRKWRAIFTTNYDNCIEKAYGMIKLPPQNPIPITSTSDVIGIDTRFEVPIYHLHGALFGLDKPNIIITEDDYTKFSERRRMLFELLKKEFATSTILYIGYANQDPNWKQLLTEISEEFYPSKLPYSYRVSPKTDPVDVEILKSKGIETINATFKEFAESAILILAENIIDQDKLQALRKDIPSNLLSAFEKNTAPVARLLSSWTYVNQAPFNSNPNLHSFLRGDRPNWGLIGNRLFFERDIEEDIYNELLDYVTSSKQKATAISILGSAGYGVSTLIMSLSAKLVMERAGSVYMLKPGQQLLEGDIEFALSLFPEESAFFFIDDAADSTAALNPIIQKLKDANKPAMFILGERINEWRQVYKKPATKEFDLEPLSDPEINRLLDYLAVHSELNSLESLSRDIQFSVIKEKHKKDLLVVMREATEGKSFDAILEDEFRGISDSLAKQLYATVCCFYQHGVYVRDELLAHLINTPLAEIYHRTTNATEGVVFFDCLNESKLQYGARARHRIIAAVIWERCLSNEERDRLTQSSLAALNLNYGSDKSAFETFTRTDRLIDGIGSLEGKTKFFETAARKDPDSPYVRQHYARMLLREGKVDLALSQIEEALKLNPNFMVLHHTKGMILKELAMTIESIDVARRRLTQSEASFRQSIRINTRDEYSYQGLAQLFIGWAQRAKTADEIVNYISKAEEIISEGLRMVRVRDGLWIESANIQKWLGNEPSRIGDLETAVEDNPGSIVARYLLGRSYRKAGRMEDALRILEPIIKNHHDEFRSFVEYAIALANSQKSYKEAIAVLKLSNLYGLSDPRYIATLGGMLFMDKNFTEADEIFSQATKRNFTTIELNTIQFRPPNFESPQVSLQLKGTVATVKAGYAFIESQNYPNFLCPGSKFGGLVMKNGLTIIFEPVFTSRGYIADKPRLLI